MNHEINIVKLCLIAAVTWIHHINMQKTASYTTKVNFCEGLNCTLNNSSTDTEQFKLIILPPSMGKVYGSPIFGCLNKM